MRRAVGPDGGGQGDGVDAEATPDTAGTQRLTWWVSFAIMATLAGVWTFAVPLMDSPDEPTHAIKAAAVARGELTTSYTIVVSAFGIRPVTEVEVPRAYADLTPIASCFVHGRGPRAPCALASQVGPAGPTTRAGTYVGTYPPLYYAIVGWPSRLLRPEDALYAMRLIGALICSALLASGLTSASRCSRRRLVVAASVLGITPMVIFLTASINPNGLEIASAFCVWLAALELVRHRGMAPTRLMVRLGVSSVLLVGSRPLSPAFVVVILGAVALLAGQRPALRRLASDPRVRATAAVIAAATLGSAVFVIVNHSATAILKFPLTGHPSHLETAHHSLDLTGARIHQMIGVLGWLNLTTPPLPTWLVDGWEIAILLLGVVALTVGTWRHRLVLLALVSGVLVMPVVSEGVGAATYGYAWQGRYALPIAVGIPIVSGWVIDASNALPIRVERWIAAVVAAWVAVGLVIAQGAMLAQLMFGVGARWTRAFESVPWAGPLSPAVLMAACSAAGVALAAWLIALS